MAARIFSLGLDHHNITVKPAPEKRLSALGLRIDQESADDTSEVAPRSWSVWRKKSDGPAGRSRPPWRSSLRAHIPLVAGDDHAWPRLPHLRRLFQRSWTRRPDNAGGQINSWNSVRAIGFRTTDWFEGIATFLTCNSRSPTSSMLSVRRKFVFTISPSSCAAAPRITTWPIFLATQGHPILWDRRGTPRATTSLPITTTRAVF